MNLFAHLSTISCRSDFILSAWILGFCWFLILPQLPNMSLLLLLLALSLIVFLKKTWIAPFVVFLLSSCYVNWNYAQHINNQLPSSYQSKNITVIGRIIGLPDRKQSRTKFRYKIDRLLSQGEKIQHDLQLISGQTIELSCYRCNFDFKPDQSWQLTVRLKRPHGYASSGAFDFEKYLFRNQVIARGYVRTNEVNKLLTTNDNTINSFRWHIKNQLNNSLDDSTPAKAMIAALMIGDKSIFTNQQRLTLQSTGISHLMAISGLHIALVFFAVSFLLKWMLMPVALIFNWQPRQRIVLLPALTAALTYSALAGFAVSTQRAFIMLCVFVICRFFARDITLDRVLLLAASIILVLDPFSILDVGFWLSCVAVLVIAIASKESEQLSLWRLQPLLWLGMIPITVLFFGQISIISPLVNLLMVPLFCLILIPLVLLSLVLLQIGFVDVSLWLLEYLSLAFDFIYRLLAWCRDIPNALFFPTSIGLLQLSFITIVIYSFWRNWKLKWLFLLISLLVLGFTVLKPNSDVIQIAVLDVGQGLSIVIEADDYVMVYDTGPAYPSGFNAVDAVLLPYLRSKGINSIDHLIISHADNDHFGGYTALNNAMHIKQVITSRVDKIPGSINCVAGQEWQAGVLSFEILSPIEISDNQGNNSSCVLLVSNSAFRTLITGDIEKIAENRLMNSGTPLAADFLIVPHHGSNTSSTSNFIDAISPKLAIASTGYLNRYRHPHINVINRFKQRGINLLTTAKSGSIVLQYNAKDWLVKQYRLNNRHFWSTK